MTTREILSQLEYDAAGWQSEGTRGLRWHLNECHRFMMSGDIWQHVYVDPSTGRPFALTTTDAETSGTYQYDAPNNCRKIYDIAVDTESDFLPDVFYNYYSRQRGQWPAHQYNFIFGGRKYIRTNAWTRSATGGNNAYAVFPFNPGSTTNTYYLFYYELPTEISSDSINPDMADQYHQILIDGVKARIGKKSYGDVNAWEYWKENIVKKQYWKVSDQSFQVKTNYVPQRV